MLAPLGLLPGFGVDPAVMRRTLEAVVDTWQWDVKIWGWDYPMAAMTAARLGERQLAVDLLLKDGRHNTYLANGHCPQPGADLAVYLPANGALLAAVAMMAGGWDGASPGLAPGFPELGAFGVTSNAQNGDANGPTNPPAKHSGNLPARHRRRQGAAPQRAGTLPTHARSTAFRAKCRFRAPHARSHLINEMATKCR